MTLYDAPRASLVAERVPLRSVLVMTVVHHPSDSRIWFREIDALLAAGWHVTYAAPFSGYNLLPPAIESVHGGTLTVIDLPRARGLQRASANRAARKALKQLASQHDLVLVHDPELLAAAGGLGLRNLVWDVHEDPGAALQVKNWMPKSIRPAAAAAWLLAERWAERSHELLLAEFDYQRRFRRDHPVVPNTVVVPPEITPPGRDRVVYLGTVTEARGCSLMIEVGRALHERTGGAVNLEIVGDAPESCCTDALDRAAQDGVLTWRGFVPSRRALSIVSGAVAGLSLLDDLPNYRSSLPTKVVEYAAMGVPVITTPLPLAEQIVRSANCGLVVSWRDPEAVVRAVIALRDDP